MRIFATLEQRFRICLRKNFVTMLNYRRCWILHGWHPTRLCNLNILHRKILQRTKCSRNALICRIVRSITVLFPNPKEKKMCSYWKSNATLTSSFEPLKQVSWKNWRGYYEKTQAFQQRKMMPQQASSAPIACNFVSLAVVAWV